MKNSINESKNRLKKLAGLLKEGKDVDLSNLSSDINEYNQLVDNHYTTCIEIQKNIYNVGLGNRIILNDYISKLEEITSSIKEIVIVYRNILGSKEGEYNLDDNTFDKLLKFYDNVELFVDCIDDLKSICEKLQYNLEDVVRENLATDLHSKYTFVNKKIDQFKVDPNDL